MVFKWLGNDGISSKTKLPFLTSFPKLYSSYSRFSFTTKQYFADGLPQYWISPNKILLSSFINTSPGKSIPTRSSIRQTTVWNYMLFELAPWRVLLPPYCDASPRLLLKTLVFSGGGGFVRIGGQPGQTLGTASPFNFRFFRPPSFFPSQLFVRTFRFIICWKEMFVADSRVFW